MDRKDDFLNAAHHVVVNKEGTTSNNTINFPAAYTKAAKLAMDEYSREQVLELLEYVGENIKWTIKTNGTILFWDGKEYLTKEKLLTNFYK